MSSAGDGQGSVADEAGHVLEKGTVEAIHVDGPGKAHAAAGHDHHAHGQTVLQGVGHGAKLSRKEQAVDRLSITSLLRAMGEVAR